MSEPVGSYIDREGRGSSALPWRAWEGSAREAFTANALDRWRWSECFETPCPRFGRMDGLCKLALAAVELLDLSGFDEALRRDTAVVLHTETGCESTDLAFLDSLSPALFAYTLPSTPLGEIAIRHRLQGPMLCLAGPANAWVSARELLDEGQARACLLVHADFLAPDATGGGLIRAAAVRLDRESKLPGSGDLPAFCREHVALA